MIRIPSLSIGVVYIAAYVAGAWLLAGYPLARAILGNVALLVPPIVVCLVIQRRRRSWTGCQRLFWDTLGIGVALWALGHVGWAVDEIVFGRVSWLRWHTVFSLCGGLGPLVALLARPYRGTRPASTATTAITIASYGLLGIFLYSYYVLVPGLMVQGGDADVTLLSLVQLHRAVLLAATAIAFYFAYRTAWRVTFGYLLLATALGYGLRFAANLAILDGAYRTGTIYDLAWIVPYLLYAQAAWVAPDSPATRTAADRDRPLHLAIAAVPVFLVPILGYGELMVGGSAGAAGPLQALLTGLMTIGGVGLLTLQLAMQTGELQRRDARLRLLAAATEQTADLILITRADGLFEHANDAFVRALGYSRRELAGLSSADMMERGCRPIVATIRQNLREHGTWRGTLVRQRRDGTTFPASCTVVALKDEAGAVTHFVGVERDITEELKLRDQLVQSERLSAIGELVAGVAHEINNPLQTIVGAVELMMEERSGPPTRRDLEMVRREATRAGQIVRNLLSFIRRSAPDRVATDLNAIVQATVELRQFHLRQRNIAVVLHLHPAPLPVLVNREEIQQVVLNLLLNAEQAILGSRSEGAITIRSWTEPHQHILEVADDGPGVSAELRGRVFEPFFTTKEVGEGTGLGLAISHGIAMSHGGSLELRESPKGACFRLTLPARIEASTPQQSVAASAADYGTGAEAGTAVRPMALVIDDEPAIRHLLARVLERRGFEVEQTDDGDAALALGETERLRLVLCDVRMPGVDGAEIYRRLRGARPDLASRFIFITGDGAALASEHPDLAPVPVLVKPFTSVALESLLERIDQPA